MDVDGVGAAGTGQHGVAGLHRLRGAIQLIHAASGEHIVDLGLVVLVQADAGTPALMAAYDAELLHMKRDGRLKALYDKYGIPYIEP